MRNISISFLIPCYNCSKTIDDAVVSILNLKLKNFEICMVDDCSNDNTLDILKKYQKNYPDIIKIARNEKNIGAGMTRNKGFQMTKFDYIFMLDADNILHPGSFWKLIDNSGEEDDLITFGTIKFFYPFKLFNIYYKDFVFAKSEMKFEDLRKSVNTPAMDGNYLYKRGVFEKVNGYESNAGVDTWGFGYKILASGYKYRIIKGAFYYHRVQRNSYWFRNISYNFQNWKKFLLNYAHGLSKDELEKIRDAEDILPILINRDNDFSKEIINPFFSLLLKVYYKIWRIPEAKK